MIFYETKLRGAYEIHLEPITEERGFFARSWCQKEFAHHGLTPKLAQCNVSVPSRKATLRGLHFQAAPFAETKLVRCTRGAIYDVVLDLRPHSPTFRDQISVVLTVEKRNMVYVPEGCGHGFLTLEGDIEVFYQMSEFYNAEAARGVRWDDPAFQIAWPEKVEVISERDRTYPDFELP
jgi:dTDP-4-dehydrorhamnose 3,5-epimerase